MTRNAARIGRFIAPSLLGLMAVSGSAAAVGSNDLFVHLKTPKHDLFVGESVPVDIVVGALDGVSATIDNPPTLRGDAFTLGLLSARPDRSLQLIAGSRFSVLTWHSVLSAIKPGSRALTLEVPLTVTESAAGTREPIFADEIGSADSFSDPAMQSLMQVATTRTEVTSSEPIQLEVRELPARGRPRDFNGAVGQFTVWTETSQTTLRVGDPFVLRMHVTGSGNFDRVASSMLRDVDAWKAYAPKPVFHPHDPAGYRGDKVFEQPVVPIRVGPQSIPALEFSYFDPDAREYRTVQATPVTLQVGHAPAGRVSALRGDHVALAATSATLSPPYAHPAYLTVSMMAGGAFLMTWLLLKRREAVGLTSLPPPPRSAEDLLAEMRIAVQQSDGRQFFTAATTLLRMDLAQRRRTEPHLLEPDAVRDSLDSRSELRDFLQRSEETLYGSNAPAQPELLRWQRAIVEYREGDAAHP